MDSLIGYGSDDDVDSDRCAGPQHSTVGGGQRRRDDDTNYDDVNMDMSEESQGAESEPELPPAEPVSSRHSSTEDRRSSGNVSCSSDGSRSRSRSVRGERSERRWRHREEPHKGRARSDRTDRHDRNDKTDRLDRSDRPDRSERSDDRPRSDRSDRGRSGYEGGSSRRGLLGDRPDDNKVPALMDLKPFGGEPPPGFDQRKPHDARDAASPRFTDRERRDRERDRDRGERHSRRSEERSGRSAGRAAERRERSRSRGAAYPPPHGAGQERRGSPTSSGEYRPSSYKVNKKLEVMEKMGLQIKTPDGMMATAQQLRAAASEAPAHSGLPSYYNAGALNTNKILDQVQKRKLLWSNKNKSDADEAAKWSGTRFAQDSDGKQVSKFMRLMGIKEPATVKPETTEKSGDPIKKQEELFQAMQAQYEVARATTHTMRGVGLGFQRGQY